MSPPCPSIASSTRPAGELGTLGLLNDALLIKRVLPHCIEDQFLPGFSQTCRKARSVSLQCALSRLNLGAHTCKTLGATRQPLSDSFWDETRVAQQFVQRFVKPAPDFGSHIAAWAEREILSHGSQADVAKDRMLRAWQAQSDKLELSNLNLKSLPAHLEPLVSLKQLDVSGNALSSLPDSIVSLENLVDFDASRNRLTHLPQQIYRLFRLENLFIFQNKIDKLPQSFHLLPKLERFNANHNELVMLPTLFARLNTLKSLMISHNLLASLPVGMAHLDKLEGLWLDHNRLCDIEEAIAFLPNLRFLTIHNNPLTSAQPSLRQFIRAREPAPYKPPAGGLTRNRPWYDWFRG